MSRTVQIAATLPASPDRLYDMYVDARTHTAFTGFPAVVSPEPGAPFSAFGGTLRGRMLHVEPKWLIVQTWRSTNWPPDAADGVLVLTFYAEGDGGRIELVHTNVPEVDFAGVSQGWEKFYWTPWRAYLERNPHG